MYIYMNMNEASIPMNHYVLPLWSPPKIFYFNFLQSCAALGSLHLPFSHQQHPENRITSEWVTLGPFLQSLARKFYKLLVLQSTRQKFCFWIFFSPLYKMTAGKKQTESLALEASGLWACLRCVRCSGQVPGAVLTSPPACPLLFTHFSFTPSCLGHCFRTWEAVRMFRDHRFSFCIPSCWWEEIEGLGS